MQLDIRTIIVINIGLGLLIGVSTALAAARYPRPLRDSLRRWAIGTLLQPLGWLMFTLHDFRFNDPWLIVFGNLVLAVGYAECVVAMRHFMGHHAPARPVYLAAGIAIAAVLVFGVLWTEPRLRVVIAALALAWIFLLGTIAPMSGPVAMRGPGHRITAAFFALGTVVLLIRAGDQIVGTAPLSDFLSATPLQALIFSASAFGPVLGTFGFMLMVNDRFNAELARLAQTDSLTGALTRRTLQDHATAAIAFARRRGESVALALVDADHFKAINDSLGHEAGDRALEALVGALRSVLRAEDRIGRIGGEEFVVLMPDTDIGGAFAAGERLRRAVADTPIAIAGRSIELRVTVGIAALRDGEDFAQLLKRADAALYEGKRRGRDRVVVDTPAA